MLQIFPLFIILLLFFRHRYLVPKRCVQWKSDDDHATQIHYSELHIAIPIKGKKGTILELQFAMNRRCCYVHTGILEKTLNINVVFFC